MIVGCPSSTIASKDISSLTTDLIWTKKVSECDQDYTKITNCRLTHGTAKKSHTTIMRHQEDKLSKATSSLFPIKLGRNDLLWPSLITVQMVPVRCISRSHRLKVDFRDENFKSLLV